MSDEERVRARKKALALLTDMDRTEAMLLEKLRKAGFSEELCEDALAYVKSYGYVDDEHYADHYIEYQRERRSRRRIAYDLSEKKKLTRDQVSEALERAGDWDEKPLIRELALKKLRKADIEDADDRRKLAAYLSRQGFGASDIFSVLDELRAEET